MVDVLIIAGSKSDEAIVKKATDVLDELNIPYNVQYASAHREPDRVKEIVISSDAKVMIAIAGLAAALPGVVASHTTLPVVGIPIETKISGGLDSILSILQMPSGIPVATMPAGKAGGSNAALFAINILGIENETYKNKLIDYRKNMIEKIKKKNDNIKSMGYENYIKSLEEKK